MVNIIGYNFDIYNTKYRGFYGKKNRGVYVLCDNQYNPIYVGMSNSSISNRIDCHKSKGWNIKFILIHEVYNLGFKDYLKKINKKLNFVINIKLQEQSLCYFLKTIEYNVYKDYFLNVEKKLIKSLKPKYNIIHNAEK